MLQFGIMDLDTFSDTQPDLLARSGDNRMEFREWGPVLRMACQGQRLAAFRMVLEDRLERWDSGPRVLFTGSGDFHHLTLPILELLPTPCNLLVIDKHPDWVMRIPVIHCGTWLSRVGRLSHIHRIIHLGGDLDFDNGFRLLAPWGDLKSGRIRVIPAVRRYSTGRWPEIPHEPLRPNPGTPCDSGRANGLIAGLGFDLRERPLYISIDKDVLSPSEAVTNWDQGSLGLDEICMVLGSFVEASGGRLVGADITGDWTPVHVRGPLSGLLHRIEHPRQTVDARRAALLNQRANLRLLDILLQGK